MNYFGTVEAHRLKKNFVCTKSFPKFDILFESGYSPWKKIFNFNRSREKVLPEIIEENGRDSVS